MGYDTTYCYERSAVLNALRTLANARDRFPFILIARGTSFHYSYLSIVFIMTTMSKENQVRTNDFPII